MALGLHSLKRVLSNFEPTPVPTCDLDVDGSIPFEPRYVSFFNFESEEALVVTMFSTCKWRRRSSLFWLSLNFGKSGISRSHGARFSGFSRARLEIKRVVGIFIYTPFLPFVGLNIFNRMPRCSHFGYCHFSRWML